MRGEVSVMSAKSIDQRSDKSKHVPKGHTTVVVDSRNDSDVKSQPSCSFRGDNGHRDRTPKPALHPKNSSKTICTERHSAIASSGLAVAMRSSRFTFGHSYVRYFRKMGEIWPILYG